MSGVRFLLLVIIILIIAPALFTSNAMAGTEDATMSDLQLTATPHRQGIGGEIMIDASISFFGGCCYPLFAYDLEITINIPEKVILVSGEPTRTIDEIEAYEGGGPTTRRFIWIVKSLVPGSYIITANLTTGNCGNSNAEITIEVTEGFSFTIPQVYPDMPTTAKESTVRLDITSGLEGIEAETVNLFYIRFTDNMPSDAKDFYAENASLIWSSGSNVGKSIEMTKVPYSESTWTGEIPRQNEESEIYYWIVVEDNSGKNTTSVLYSIEVFDMDRVYFFVDFLNLIPIIGTIIGILLIIFLFNKVRAPHIGIGELVLGTPPSKNIPFGPSQSTAKGVESDRLNRQRSIVIVILLIISIILLIWAIYSGDFEEFMRINGGL